MAITWALEPGGPAGTLHFTWVESGGPPVAPPKRQGFGSRLLQRVLTAQVRAEVSMDYPPEGFTLTMRMDTLSASYLQKMELSDRQILAVERIKVVDPDVAIAELSALVGFPLDNAAA